MDFYANHQQSSCKDALYGRMLTCIPNISDKKARVLLNECKGDWGVLRERVQHISHKQL